MSGEVVNRVVVICKDDVPSIKSLYVNDDKTLLIELDGMSTQSWNDYITVIQESFQFPTSCYDSIDRYEDWMRDLEWLNKEGFVLIINNFDSFLKNDGEVREMVILGFTEIILPFWEVEVKNVVVEGQPKSFQVYCVS